MMAKASQLMLCCVIVVASVLAVARAAPTLEQCRTAGQALASDTSQLLRLQPCQNGPSAQCCPVASSFFTGGSIAGCNCVPGAPEATAQALTSNSLAQSAGITLQRIQTILQGCGIPYYGGTGSSACPGQAGGAAPAGGATPAPAPAGAAATPAPAPAGAAATPAPATASSPAASGGASSNAPSPPPTQQGYTGQKFCKWHPFLCSLHGQQKG